MSEDLRKLINDILREGYLISLGTVDDGGVWVADVIYISDDNLNLYWLSLPDARHSKVVERGGKVACTITSNWATNEERGLQIEGLAERIDGPMFELEKSLRAKRKLSIPTKPGEVLSEGHVWYKLKPLKIELIHNRYFGYDKQILILD